MKSILSLLVCLICVIAGYSQSIRDSLTTKLASIHDLGYLPGFGVAIVSDEGVHYQNGFGFSDVESEKPFTIHSLQNIGSISKTFTGIALMKLVEDKLISLDDPINKFLPLNIHNPYFPEEPITIRHLARHTASFNDPEEYEHTYLFSQKIELDNNELPKDFRKLAPLYNANENMPVDEFINKMLHPFGEWYSKKNFLRKKPGTTYQYSNMGAALAGYIIQLATGEDYRAYTRKLIMDPLGMDHSGWTHDAVDMSEFVGLYLSNDQKIPPYSLVSYADGGLITNIHDLSLYFSEMINGYVNGNSKILKAESIQAMMNPAFTSEKKNSGIFWTINGKGEFGHSGGDPGIMTFMMFDPETGIGRIVFTNKYDEGSDGLNQVVYIWKTLEKYMTAIVGE